MTEEKYQQVCVIGLPAGIIDMGDTTMKTIPITPSDIKPKDRERFWRKVDIVDDGVSCWNWIGSTKPYGYGTFRLSGKTMEVHRISWVLTYGRIPQDRCILHFCDNPSCVRPSHLFTGTQEDNIRDAIAKGRKTSEYMRGEKNFSSKLTQDQVREIKQKLLDGETPTKIAKDYPVVRQTISEIKHGKIWKSVHVKGEEILRLGR